MNVHPQNQRIRVRVRQGDKNLQVQVRHQPNTTTRHVSFYIPHPKSDEPVGTQIHKISILNGQNHIFGSPFHIFQTPGPTAVTRLSPVAPTPIVRLFQSMPGYAFISHVQNPNSIRSLFSPDCRN